MENNKSYWANLDVELLKPAPWFFSKPESLLNFKLVTSINRFGQLKNIIVHKDKEDYIIIDGHRIVSALKELKIKKAVCCVLNKSIDMAKILSLSSNLLQHEKDYVKIAKLVKEFKDKLEILEPYLPYSNQELQNQIELLEFSWEENKNINDNLMLFNDDELLNL